MKPRSLERIPHFQEGIESGFPFDGVAVISGDREDLVNALGTVEGLQAVQELLEDEARFIDLSRSAIWIAEEHEILAKPNR